MRKTNGWTVCLDNLSQIYLSFHFVTKKMSFRNMIENGLQGNNIISFVNYDHALLKLKSLALFILFFYINGRKYWFHENFWLLVFDGFICFGMCWTRFDYFWKMPVCLCVWQKYCAKCSNRTNAQNFMKFYISVIWSLM